MHKSIVILIIGFTSLTFASPKEIVHIYENFSKQKTELLKADLNKKNIKETVANYYKQLNASYEEVKKLENDSKKDLLTNEGNQMAYDIEVLEPLKILASGLMTKEDCVKAKHEHSLNFPVIADDDSKAIDNILNKVCLN